MLVSLVFCAISNASVKFDKFINTPLLRHAQWSFYAEYADTGKEIFSVNSNHSLAPASGLKLITTGVALLRLGADFRFKTSLYYDGNITEEGALNGNVYIVGGGDPTLGSALVKGSHSLDTLMHSWVEAIRKKGIRKINGMVIAETSLFDEKSVPDFWSWGDIGNYYGAGTSALCIHDNLYFLYFKPGGYVGDIAKVIRTEPEIPYLSFRNFMRTGKAGSGDNGCIYCAPNQYVATLRGTIPAGKEEFSIKGALPNPSFFAVQYLTSWLRKKGIEVFRSVITKKGGHKYIETNKIHTTYSPPLSRIIEIVNKKSVNLYAEQLIKMIARDETGKGSTKNGIEIIISTLESLGIDTAGFSIFDGSGLSRSNMVTTKIFVRFLSLMSHQKSFHSFYRSLSRAGYPNDMGYVKKFGAGTHVEQNARIKTGYITGVRSYSGYINTRSGKLISFSFICNNFTFPLYKIDKIYESILIQLAELP